MDILAKMLFGATDPHQPLSADHFLAPQTISLGSNHPSESPVGTTSTSSRSSTTDTTLEQQNDSHPVDTTTLASADFDVDVHSGFLSPSAPLKRLSNPEYQVWEIALDFIQKILEKQESKTSVEELEEQVNEWKTHVTSTMGILKIEPLLMDIIELRRAHLVLAFLTHAFVHADSLIINLLPPQPHQNENVTIPATLAVPFCQISHALDIPPVLTYADTVLYNWYFKNPALGFTVANLEITTTFTQTESEKHFYKTSVLVEALGPECLKLMRSSLDEAFMGDEISIKRIGKNLGKLSKQIDSISKVLGEVRIGCDPATFYWDIRPWFNAGKWTWEGVIDSTTTTPTPTPLQHHHHRQEDQKNWRVTDFGGPSAGQSTLIHAIDVFLGIDHEPSRQEIETGIQAEETFMNRMSTYMPHHHRQFLHHLSQSCSLTQRDDDDNDTFSTTTRASHLIRSIVLNNQDQNSSLKNNYNACVKSLRNLRNTHTNIVCLFIISQKNSKHSPLNFRLSTSSNNIINNSSKTDYQKKNTLYNQEQEPEEEETCNSKQVNNQSKIDSNINHTRSWEENVDEQEDSKNHVLKGTGGTDLTKFLKRCRLRTSEALLPDDD